MSGYKPAEQIARDIATRCEPPPELREQVARAINDGLGESWAYSNYSGNEWAHCRDMLDSAADAVLAILPTPAEVATLRARVAELEADNARLLALVPDLDAQADDDAPGLYLRFTTMERRDAARTALGGIDGH